MSGPRDSQPVQGRMLKAQKKHFLPVCADGRRSRIPEVTLFLMSTRFCSNSGHSFSHFPHEVCIECGGTGHQGPPRAEGKAGTTIQLVDVSVRPSTEIGQSRAQAFMKAQ